MTPAVLATIGYEGTTVQRVVEVLRDARVALLVDVRAVASSRRPGFSKTKLAAHLEDAGIGYLHLRSLGTPAEGRAAARAGRHEEMRRIFGGHLSMPEAQQELEQLAEIIGTGRRCCLLCFEADHRHCHRTMVAAAVSSLVPVDIVHLAPHRGE
jgi:uncharacterized protein (DUF488 family)